MYTFAYTSLGGGRRKDEGKIQWLDPVACVIPWVYSYVFSVIDTYYVAYLFIFTTKADQR